MTFKQFRFAVMLSALTYSASSTQIAVTFNALLADDKIERSSTPISQLLAEESAGGLVDRRQLLKQADTPAAHWQAGQIQRDGKWLDADQLNDVSEREREYERLRSDLSNDAQRDRKLAKWCHRNDLPLQARAHWNAVIEQSPNDLDARRQLGHQCIEGVWYTDHDIRRARETSRSLLSDLKKWNTPVFKIVEDLKSNDSSDKQLALQKLNEIDDPSSIASVEMAAFQTDGHVAKLLINNLAKHSCHAACLALTRIAMAQPRSERGLHAIGKLKEYDPTYVVPELLNLLSTPIETRVQYGFNQRGELMLDRIMFRESNDRRELLQLQRLVRTNENGVNAETALRRTGGTRTTNQGPALAIVQVGADEEAANSLAADEQAQLEREIAAANRRQEEVSRNASYVLSELTGQPAENGAQEWWKWWQDKNYRPAKTKPLGMRRYQYVDRPTLTLNSNTVSPQIVDCLVAGTLVQTSSGTKPIEALKRGDLVLSQDVESGQLDLKPVMQVVPREPGIIAVIKTESDEIRSTQGHRWWVSGKGWVMAADLEPGMSLHTATGTVRVNEVREDAEQPTFNLVVDEYHTYFVGKDRVLSFDNVDPRPTLRKVPGY